MLHHANAIVLNNRVAYNGDTVMISLKDLQCLVAGAALLDTKATNVYTTLVNKLPAHARRQYQLEEWYQDTVNVSNAAKASQQVQKVVTRKNGIGSGRLGMQPGAAIPPPSAPKVSLDAQVFLEGGLQCPFRLLLEALLTELLAAIYHDQWARRSAGIPGHTLIPSKPPIVRDDQLADSAKAHSPPIPRTEPGQEESERH